MNIHTQLPGDGGGLSRASLGGIADYAITSGPAPEPAETPSERGRALDGFDTLTDEQARSVFASVIQPKFLHVLATLDCDVVHRTATSFLAYLHVVTESPAHATVQLPREWSTVADTIQLSGTTRRDTVTTRTMPRTLTGDCRDGATTQWPEAAAPVTVTTTVAATQSPVTLDRKKAAKQIRNTDNWPIPPDTLCEIAGHLADALVTESIDVINTIIDTDAMEGPQCATCTSNVTQLTKLLHPNAEATQLAIVYSSVKDDVIGIGFNCNCAINNLHVDRAVRILRDAIVQRIRSQATHIDRRDDFNRLVTLAFGKQLVTKDKDELQLFWAEIHLSYSKNPYCKKWGFLSKNDGDTIRRGKPRPPRRQGHGINKSNSTPNNNPHAWISPCTADDDDRRGEAASGDCSSWEPAFVSVAMPISDDHGYHIHHHHYYHTTIIGDGVPLTFHQQGDDDHPHYHDKAYSVGPTGELVGPPLYDSSNVSRTTPADQQRAPGVGLPCHDAGMHTTSAGGIPIGADALDSVHGPLLSHIFQNPVIFDSHHDSRATDQPCAQSDVPTAVSDRHMQTPAGFFLQHSSANNIRAVDPHRNHDANGGNHM